tara:strand:+ start:320 stop:748 length:429 start_codon:yes stop_codon:yes gene_type:complete
MNSLQNKMDQITEHFSPEENDLFISSMFPYIMSKASSYLEEGPSKYRSSDAFNMPLAEWSAKDNELIKTGCTQIMEGIGFMTERPFKKLGVRGFNILFTMLHFRSIKRKTKRLGLGKMLDEITFQHVVTKEEVTYFNLVERD